MSNEISIFDQKGANLPAHLQQYQQHAQDAAGFVTGFASLPKMSIKGKQFRYVKDDREVVYRMGQPLLCVILATDPPQGVSKAWYEGAYSEGAEFTLPDCFSADGVKPDGLAESPQARSCAECPKNAFGSGIDQQGNPTRGKACADVKNLFIVESHLLDEQVMVMRVPATSLKALSQYGRTLAQQNCPPQLIVTEITFSDAVHPQLEFRAVGWLEEADAAKMIERSDSDEVQLALPSKNIIDVENVDAAPEKKPTALPSPPVEELPKPDPRPVITMTEKAKGVSYESFVTKGWSDEQLIANGYMEKK